MQTLKDFSLVQNKCFKNILLFLKYCKIPLYLSYTRPFVQVLELLFDFGSTLYMKEKYVWVSIKDKPILIQFLKTLPLHQPYSYITLARSLAKDALITKLKITIENEQS